MTVLQALYHYYDRMQARGEAETAGYSREKISFAIVLSAAGKVVGVTDLREAKGKKLLPRLLDVPAAIKRTANVAPNLFWDKSAYVLGRTAGTGKRTADEHAAFKDANLKLLAQAHDEGLVALRSFLESWKPEQFGTPPFTADMLDTNLVFQLAGDNSFIHQREAARQLIAAQSSAATDDSIEKTFCLITGEETSPRRLHPSIKGVEGAQSSGAALVSFNLDAFSSYGKEQGDNAPTSELAAYRYGEALNRMLDRNSGNRLPRPVGDATVLFWADASGVGEETAREAEALFTFLLEPPATDESGAANLDQDAGETARLRDTMLSVAQGRPLKDVAPKLAENVRFHVLGLSPNAARLSVRYWLTDRFDVFADRMQAHYQKLNIEPRPWRTPPSVQRLLVRTTALQEKFDNIPPLLAGEVMRAILSGAPYPRSLLAAAIIRLRAGDDPATGWHAAAIRAVLTSHTQEEIPVGLDRESKSSAYQLGRMFAALEAAQRMALGNVNATIRDRYFGAASATPASVFPLLLRGAQNHLGKLRKEGKDIWIERQIEEITGRLEPQLPRTLRLEEQGRFAIGYYHQRQAQYAKKSADGTDTEETSNDE